MRLTFLFVLVLAGVLAKPKVNPRISDGQEAPINSLPYVAYLTFFKYKDGTSWHCGGTLLSKNYVLTSAGCSIGAIMSEVILGVHDIYKAETNQIILQCPDIMVHPDFNSDTYANDIALIKFPQPITYNDGVQSATLPTAYSDAQNGESAIIAGWGITASTGKISEVLLEAEVTLTDKTTCESSLGTNINDNELCTAGASTCEQDYGGPLILKGTNNVVGVASRGDSSCKGSVPAVYTNVASYLEWIKANSDVQKLS